MCAVRVVTAISVVCNSVKRSQLFVVTSAKPSVDPITNPNLVSSKTQTSGNIILIRSKVFTGAYIENLCALTPCCLVEDYQWLKGNFTLNFQC
jgi:hypothetical protein